MGDSQPQPPSQPMASSDPMLLQQRISQLEAELRETKALMVGLAGSAGSKLGTTIEERKSRKERQKIAEDRDADLLAPSDVATPIPTPLSTATVTPTSTPEAEKPRGAELVPGVTSDGFDPSLHLLLILSDSALPLGSFAFSSGLESYLTHHQASTTPSTPQQSPTTLLRRFLSLSLSSLATTTLPFITAAYNIPHSSVHNNAASSATAAILNLSDTFDATTTCPVLRRASTTQGKALLSVWEKSLRQPQSSNPTSALPPADIQSIITSYRQHNNPDSPPHLPIAWALISLFSNLTLHQTTFVFLLNHTKALLSAAVRLNLIGPYVAQKILASPQTLEMVSKAQKVGLGLGIEDAGQTVPTLDLYQGRHELLYSRVFNS